MIEIDNHRISLRRQCEMLDFNISSYYYESHRDIVLNLVLMKLIDEQYTRTPFYGSPRMTWILRSKGYRINHKRVEQLMHLMGISAIYPKPRTSHSSCENKVYPYLLKGLKITHPNQVWCADLPGACLSADRADRADRYYLHSHVTRIFIFVCNYGLV